MKTNDRFLYSITTLYGYCLFYLIDPKLVYSFNAWKKCMYILSFRYCRFSELSDANIKYLRPLCDRILDSQELPKVINKWQRFHLMFFAS